MRLFRIAGGALILILASTEAKAQDIVSEVAVVAGASPFSPLSNGVLTDPLFMPPKGRLYGSGVSTITLATSDVYDAAGARLYGRVRHDIGLSHALAYGLTSRLSLRGSLGYSFNSADDTAPTGVVTRTSGRAFSNSGFGLAWRAVDQRRHPFVLDLSLNYSPTFLINDPSLRQAVSASIGVGRAMRDLTVQLIGSATWRPTHSYVPSGATAEIEQGSTLDYTLAIRTQFRLSPSVAADLGANYALNATRLTIDRANDLSSGETAPAALTLSAGLAYQLVPNRLGVGVYYSRQFQSDSSQAGSNPTQTIFTRNASSNVVTGKIYYVID